MEDEKVYQVLSELGKTVPKFCTTLNMSLLDNKKNVVMSMFYNEPINENANHNVLIDRIIIDIDLAVKLRDALNNIFNDAGLEEK